MTCPACGRDVSAAPTSRDGRDACGACRTPRGWRPKSASPEHARLAADLEEARARAAMHRREAERLRTEAANGPAWRAQSTLARARAETSAQHDAEQAAAMIESEIGETRGAR